VGPPRSQTGDSLPGRDSIDVAAVWASARPRVAATLARRGAQPADADDVVQEVAVRALARDRQFRSEEHFVRWCCRVAINLRIDAVRQDRRLGPPLAADAPGVHDTARDAEHRMALDRLATIIAELSPDDRRLLFDTTPADSRREAVRLAVRRHRLRARLASMVEGLAAAFGAIRRLPRNMSTPAKLAVAAMPIVVAGLAIAPLLAPQAAAPAAGADGPSRSVPLIFGVERTRAPAATLASSSARATRGTGVVHTGAAAAPPAAPVHTIVRLNTPGPPVVVAHGSRPEDHITVCTLGVVHVCVDRPRPSLLPTPNPLP